MRTEKEKMLAEEPYNAADPQLVAERLRARELCQQLNALSPIGNDVWIGGAAVICPGVTVGDGAVIGTGSVVVKDIPPGVFGAGNPCKVLRTL